MSNLEIRIEADGHYNRLEMYHEGTYIGDYERSIDDHVDLKCEEAEGATHLLLDAYGRYGKIAVRWNSSDRTKEIRTYQEGVADPGHGGPVIGLIPKAYWTKRKR